MSSRSRLPGLQQKRKKSLAKVTMRPEDEAYLQRSIEFIKQRTDEEACVGRLKTEANLRDAEKDIERLEAKLSGGWYRGALADRTNLVHARERRNRSLLLAEAYRQDDAR